MIKLQEGEFADLLPPYFREQSDVLAVSYAYKMAMQRMLAFAERTRLYADLEKQPEEVLDLMALELAAGYYDMAMDPDRKRKIIRDAIYLRMKAGTKAALRSLIQSVYPDGDVVEWFDFESSSESDVGKFDIITSEDSMQDSYDKVLKFIRQTKSASAHLRKVEYTRRFLDSPECAGVVLAQYAESRLIASEEGNLELKAGYGAVVAQYLELIIPATIEGEEQNNVRGQQKGFNRFRRQMPGTGNGRKKDYIYGLSTGGRRIYGK